MKQRVFQPIDSEIPVSATKQERIVAPAMPLPKFERVNVASTVASPAGDMPGSAESSHVESNNPTENSCSPGTLRSGGESVVEIDIAHIQRSAFQVRTMGNDEYIDQLAESIRASGLITPVIVRPVTTASAKHALYEFVAGEHRALAMKQLGYGKVKCIIKTLSDTEAALALTSDNAVRKDIDDLDRFKHLKMLREAGVVKNNREAASALKIHPSAIAQLESFDFLKPETITMLEEASARIAKSTDDLPPVKVGMSAAYAVRELAQHFPDAVHAAFEKVCNDRLPQKSVAQWVESHLRKPAVINTRKMEIYRQGFKPIKLKVTDKGAELTFDGLNIDKLYKLLEENIENIRD